MPSPKKKKATEPPRGITPPSNAIPALSNEWVLPLVALGSLRFEHLCLDILRKEYKEAQRTSLKRKKGVPQFGVDVEGFDQDSEPFVVISAKCYKNIKGWHLAPWTEDFIKHLEGHWKGKRVKHFVLAVSHECNDDDINDAARDLTAKLKPLGIQFTLWNSHKITELMKDDPALVGQYFNKYWVDAICGDIIVGHPSIEGSAPINNQSMAALNLARVAASELEAMSGKLSQAWSLRLDGALSEMRRGKSAGVRDWITDAKQDISLWESLSADTKAKALRATALVLLRDDDIEGASAVLDEADGLAAAPDRSARVILERSRSGSAIALQGLPEPLATRERELKAAMLIESAEPEAALKLLEELTGDAVTAETLRLRAIAHFIEGAKGKSLNIAKSAVDRGGDIVAPRFTLAVLQMASALAPGVQIQFGGIPDPIAPSLVRPGQEAIRLLSEAAGAFERLVADGDGEFRREAEIWMLGALLLNPDRQMEARRYARALMSRSILEPSVIAWLLHCGVPMRRGKVKKRLGDLLRRGEGTPGHVVVLALMASRLDSPGPGLAVVRRFGPSFPEAAEFFAMWRKQLGEDAGPPEENYSSAVRWAISRRDNLPLMAFLSGTGASAENLASGAEFLSSTHSYADVLSLRERLFEIGTVRALELVARAANRTKEYSIALQAIEGFRGDALPNRLRYQRIEAHEGLGQHSHVIADLRGMLADDNDPRVHDRLLYAYLRVGNLKELKIETDKALASRKLDSRQAVQIAYALRTASPETARQALEQLSDADIPPELAGILLNLADSLGGFDDLKDEMVRRMVAGGEGFGTVRRFDAVEEILAYMKERADEYRQAFGQWLGGKVPAALAMRGDEKAYGSLFLGSERSRRNNIGDAFPMLLLGHGALQPAPEVAGNPELVVDLSGILLAHRLNLLDDLDKIFRVMIPGTLPLALFQLRQQYSGPSREVAAAVVAMETGSSAVKVVDIAPEGAVRVELPGGTGNDDEWMAPTLLEHAFEDGHLTRDELEAAVRGLDLEKPPERRALPDAGVSLSARAAAQLAQSKVLEPIARSLPTYILVGDARRLSNDVETLREEESIGASLDGLQQVVADRLTSSAWRTRPNTYQEKDEERLESLPPHVTCLMDTLPTDEAKRGVLFWIEDRALSKQRLPEALYLTDILSLLIGRGLLSADRHETILRDLWSNGYSFMPGSEQEIVRVLEQAPIVDGEVVENGVLTDLRRWFAMQASNLAYIDPNPHVDADGNIVGETRQLIELATLLKDTLLSIWRHPDKTLEQRLARSAWVSTRLRLEHAPGAMADTTPAGRRRLASLVAAQIISVPLFAELMSEEMSDGDRQMYVNWALSVVDVTRNADPELFSVIVETLAGMASRILEDPPETDESLRRKLRAHMRNIVHRFLSLLPSEWYDAIAARKGVGEALGRERVTTLELADGVTVRIADLPTAIREAESSGKKVRFPLHNSKDSARLASEAVKDDLPLIFLTIKKRRYSFDRTSIALIHPDISLREKAIEALRSAARVDRGISDATARVILDETDVDRRVLLFDEARGGEFRRQIEVMRERVRHGRALSIEGFDLPSPAIILDFLGLPPDYRGDAGSLATDATAALLESLGADGALERLSGLPFELPRALLDAHVSQTLGENDRRYWDSPLWALSRLVARGAPDPGSSEVEHIGQLIQAGSGIFAGLVRRTAKRAINDARWQELPVDVSISLIWTFAEHVSRAILPAGFKTASFNQWLAQNDVATFTEFERQRLWPRWAQRFGLRLTSSQVDAAIVSRLLKAGFEPSESLQALAGMERGEVWSPTPEAGSAAVVAPQGFWPAEDPIPLYINAGWLSSDSPFSLRTDTAMARRIVEESTQNAAYIGPALTLLVEVESVDRDVLIEIRETISKRLVDAPLDRTEPAHRTQLEIFAKACALLGDADLFERTISSVASTNARIWPHKRLKAAQDDESAKALDALLHAAQWFATTVGGDLSGQMRQFARHVAQIADAWPMSILAAISCLDVVARKVDASTAAEAVWPVLMELRTRR